MAGSAGFGLWKSLSRKVRGVKKEVCAGRREEKQSEGAGGAPSPSQLESRVRRRDQNPTFQHERREAGWHRPPRCIIASRGFAAGFSSAAGVFCAAGAIDLEPVRLESSAV